MALTVEIDRGLEVPVYEQIADQLRHLIALGALGGRGAAPIGSGAGPGPRS